MTDALADTGATVAALRSAGARFAYRHGSRVAGTHRPDSDVGPAERVRWEADTRVRYLDELPLIERCAREHLAAVARAG